MPTDCSVLRTHTFLPNIPHIVGLSSYILRVVCAYGCTLYLPLIAQGIDLVRELRHILVGHDALALRNQCQ